MAATRKEEKYVDLGARYIYEPIVVETLGVFNLLDDLGRRFSENTGEARERPASRTKGFRFWCSASMLSFCMTVCRLYRLNRLTDDRTQCCIYFSIF